MKYKNGEQIKVGDYITDNCSYNETKTLEAKGYIRRYKDDYGVFNKYGELICYPLNGFIDMSNGGVSKLTNIK